MANNADLIKDILALDDKVIVEGKTNKELVEILKSLRATKVEEEESVKLAPYTVAKGKSITCMKGSLKEGDEIKVAYLNNNEVSLARLIKNGFVVKN